MVYGVVGEGPKALDQRNRLADNGGHYVGDDTCADFLLGYDVKFHLLLPLHSYKNPRTLDWVGRRHNIVTFLEAPFLACGEVCGQLHASVLLVAACFFF